MLLLEPCSLEAKLLQAGRVDLCGHACWLGEVDDTALSWADRFLLLQETVVLGSFNQKD